MKICQQIILYVPRKCEKVSNLRYVLHMEIYIQIMVNCLIGWKSHQRETNWLINSYILYKQAKGEFRLDLSYNQDHSPGASFDTLEVEG